MLDVQRAGDVILFIDEVHAIGRGRGEGGIDACGILAPAGARGHQLIGATTRVEYRRHIERTRRWPGASARWRWRSRARTAGDPAGACAATRRITGGDRAGGCGRQ
ncbi:MAG: hypothetical protein ACLRRT_05615 [Ruthenibacterium lactatiformans]